MKHLLFIAVLTIGLSTVFAKEWYSIVPASNQYVYVVALERESPDEPSNQWNPTLYAIDIGETCVKKRLKLADQGAPIYCQRMGDNQIRVYVDEGVAGNGTSVGKHFSKEIIVDKQKMTIVSEKIIPGGLQHEFYDRKPSSRHDKFRERGLVFGEFLPGTIFLLSGSRNQELMLVDTESDALIQSIPLEGKVSNKTSRLSGHNGDINSAFWDDRKVILLYSGNSHTGHFAAGYVVIVDIKTREVEHIPIGTDPAVGIAY